MPDDETNNAHHLVLYALDPADWLAGGRGLRAGNDRRGAESARVAGRAAILPESPPEHVRQPFAVTFEQAAERLERLPRLYFEPDGSFVWVGEGRTRADNGESAKPSHRPWQLDGQLQEAAGRVQHVELKGDCPAAEFQQLLTALGVEHQPVIGHLVRQCCFVDAREWFGIGGPAREADK
jgi:hypothetical protein